MAWIGALPAAAFPAGQMLTANKPQTEPFVWGQGGQQLSPDDIARLREMAARQVAEGSDYSPVQSWTQGLARLSQGIIGGLNQRKADKAAAANTAEGNAVLQALLQGTDAQNGGQDVVAAALTNPNLPKEVRDFASLKYKQKADMDEILFRAQNRAPPQQSEFERALQASGITPGTPQWAEAMGKRVTNILDPLASVPLPGGQVYLGPRSGLPSVMGGGGVPAQGGMEPPDTLPPDFDFGGPTPSASGGFP